MDGLFSRICAARAPKFVMCIAGTKTSDREGLSGAGATPEDRRLTPKCDAEALVNGIAGYTSELPVSPEGIVSPVVISSACLKLLNMPVTIVDCGTFSAPTVGKVLSVGMPPAECLSSGNAQDLKNVETLFNKGLELGEELSADSDLLVVSECVPAGTTTAFAVLTGLGYDVHGAVSSSMPNFNHQMRWQLATNGLSGAGLLNSIIAGNPSATIKAIGSPLNVVAAVGDPMQPFAAGLALSASRKVPIVLGGGSQMLTVYALAKACTASGITSSTSTRNGVHENFAFRNIGIITTSWVAFDRNANVKDIASAVRAPFACSMLDFSKSRHVGLRAYENGHVKEGVGAGASVVIAHLMKNYSARELIDAIDKQYSQMVTCKA